jgi:hypothetical protein
LIQWIRDEYDNKVKDSGSSHPFHGVSALEISNDYVKCIPGTYVYVVHLWEFQGLRTETRLAFEAIRVEDGEKLSDDETEALIDKALIHGMSKPNVSTIACQVRMKAQAIMKSARKAPA